MLLVDSTVYIDILRSRKDPVDVLRSWIERDEILTCGIIRCEVLRGTVNRRVHERMADLFSVAANATIDELTWSQTSALAWKLDRKGLILPLTDLVIAVCAMRYEVSVVSKDAHFRKIPKLEVMTQLPHRLT